MVARINTPTPDGRVLTGLTWDVSNGIPLFDGGFGLIGLVKHVTVDGTEVWAEGLTDTPFERTGAAIDVDNTHAEARDNPLTLTITGRLRCVRASHNPGWADAFIERVPNLLSDV